MLSDAKKVKSFLITARKPAKVNIGVLVVFIRTSVLGSMELAVLACVPSREERMTAWLAEERQFVRDSRVHIHHPATDLVR